MIQVEALRGFEHGGRRLRGDTFLVSDQHAEELKARKLVRLTTPVPPTAPTGSGFDAGTFVAQNAADVLVDLEKVVDAAELASILAAEKAGKDRKSVVEAIEAAIAKLA